MRHASREEKRKMDRGYEGWVQIQMNNLEVSKWLFIYSRSRDRLLQREAEERAERGSQG